MLLLLMLMACAPIEPDSSSIPAANASTTISMSSSEVLDSKENTTGDIEDSDGESSAESSNGIIEDENSIERNIVFKNSWHDFIEGYDAQYPEFSELNLSLIPDDVLDYHKDKGILFYSKLMHRPSGNIQLWHDWVDSFISGKPARVLLFLYGYGFPNGTYELIADGTAEYTIRAFSFKAEYKGEYKASSILSNDFQQSFAPDIERFKTNNIIFIKPMDMTDLDYDIAGENSLGDTSPEDALSLAKSYLKNATETRPEYSNPPDPDWEVSITGAISLFGHPCYLVTSSSPQYDFIWDKEMAINADGGNLFFLSSELDGTWRLEYDDKMHPIVSAVR